MKWEQADWADQGRSITAKKEVEEISGLLVDARDVALHPKKEREEQLIIEKRRRDHLKARVTALTGQVMKVEELLCISH